MAYFEYSSTISASLMSLGRSPRAGTALNTPANLLASTSTHDGDAIAAMHYGNAYVTHKGRFRLVRKEYPNSPRKIDTVIGDALALQARSDAIETGWGSEPEGTRVFCFN